MPAVEMGCNSLRWAAVRPYAAVLCRVASAFVASAQKPWREDKGLMEFLLTL
jgi:hypothetical protein